MASGELETDKVLPVKQKPPRRGRCPLCGRRVINRSSRRKSFFPEWEARDLEQLVDSMDLREIASLLGISRWELEKRCQSLGIHIRGSNEVEE